MGRKRIRFYVNFWCERVLKLTETPVKKVVTRSFSKSVSETKIVDGKTVTETKTEQWGDNPEVQEDFWKDVDAALDAAGRALDKIGKTK